MAYSELQDYDEALDFFEKCLNLKKSLKGDESFEIVTDLTDIAGTYTFLGDSASALEY